MTSSKLKEWFRGISISIIMLSLLFPLALIDHHHILSTSAQNSEYHFYEGFEDLSSSDLLLADFDVDVTGEVPFGITSESAHNDANSLFVGPSTCGSFCFDDFSVKTTITSINLASGEYAISYWRRESLDFGGNIEFFIDGVSVYNEDADDEVWNTGVDTGWYQRFFFYNGPINSLTLFESDLTSGNTIFLDDIIIQDAISSTPSTITKINQSTEAVTGVNPEPDNQTDNQTNNQTNNQAGNQPLPRETLDLGFPGYWLGLGILAIAITIVVVAVRTGNSRK